MKKKTIIIIFLVIGSILLFLVIRYRRYLQNKVNIKLITNLETEVYNNVRVADFIENINEIDIINNYKINTNNLGKKKINFKYKKNNIKYKDSFYIEIVDKTPPLILVNNSYTITKDSNIDLTNSILCGDNYTSKPNCYIEGEYNIKEVGEYSLQYIGIDSSNNQTVKDFVLKVVEPNANNNLTTDTTSFSDIIKEYKSDSTSIGIDVSKWQEEIDFSKIKEAGAEFVIIKVAGEKDLGSGIEIDPYFYQNVNMALENNLEVGVYYNSKANNIEDAKNEALFVLNIIKEYDISLGVAYDWENFTNFNNYGVSFYTLNKIATTFLDIIKENNYNPLLYGSKYYLETIWNIDKYETWLANYNKNNSYNKSYLLWQLCNNGQISGIEGYVDIDILYR